MSGTQISIHTMAISCVGLCQVLGVPTPRYTVGLKGVSRLDTMPTHSESPVTAAGARSGIARPSSRRISHTSAALHPAVTSAAACASGTPRRITSATSTCHIGCAPWCTKVVRSAKLPSAAQVAWMLISLAGRSVSR